MIKIGVTKRCYFWRRIKISVQLFLLLVPCAFAQQVVVGTKGYSLIGGVWFWPHQLALYDMQSGTASLFFETVSGENFDAASFDHQGHFTFSGRTSVTVENNLFSPNTMGQFDWLTRVSSLRFIAPNDIAAVHIIDEHVFLIAFKVATQFGGIDYDVGDIFEYSSQNNVATVIFSADSFFVVEEGGSYAVGNIDAIAMTPTGNLLMSTTNTAEIGSTQLDAVRIRQSGVYEYDLNSGAVTTYFDPDIIDVQSADIKAFALLPDPPIDNDSDGVIDIIDQCQTTPSGSTIVANGCALFELDTDDDGVTDDIDLCPATIEGEPSNINGCAWYQLDDDFDGVINGDDFCAGSLPGTAVNFVGCEPEANNIPSLSLLGYGLLASALIGVSRRRVFLE